MNEPLERQLSELIVEALLLEDVVAADIDPEAPLFGSGLSLDSIDALELAVALEKRWGVKIRAGDEQNRRIFASVRALAQFIADHAAPERLAT